MQSLKAVRFNVVGTSSRGKSTVSKMISEKLSIPYIELDALFWGPGWSESSDEELFKSLSEKIAGDGWVLDGNYTRTIPIKWKNVEVVVWIDLPFIKTLFQAIKRAFLRSLKKEELWPNTDNRESFRKSFLSKDSIIIWTIKTYNKVKRQYEALMNEDKYSHIRFVRLQSLEEIDVFVKGLRESQNEL